MEKYSKMQSHAPINPYNVVIVAYVEKQIYFIM